MLRAFLYWICPNTELRFKAVAILDRLIYNADIHNTAFSAKTCTVLIELLNGTKWIELLNGL